MLLEIVMTKYFSFSGKATRSEFWAVNVIVLLGGWIALIGALVFSAGIALASELVGGFFVLSSFAAWLVGSLWLIIAVGVRRCRDAGISPFWVIPLVLPIMFVIMTIIFGVLPSEKQSVAVAE
jgi:uncharacterized membrane protein YhaH (DUF805 family)